VQGFPAVLRPVYVGRSFGYLAHMFSIWCFYSCLLLRLSPNFKGYPDLLLSDNCVTVNQNGAPGWGEELTNA
jgi:hypothetical protein